MSAFTGALTITHLDTDWRLWRIETPLIYEVGEKGPGRAIVVPSGFITDGASVPRFLWGMLPAWGKYSRAAVVHDYLLECLVRRDPHAEALNRRAADLIFYEAAAVSGTGCLMRWFLYAGVYIGRQNALIKGRFSSWRITKSGMNAGG